MKKIFICMIICVVGTSCSQKDVMPSILNDFPEIIHLSDGIVLIDDYMFEPYGIQVSDSLLFAYSSSSGLDQVKITDLRTMRDISFLKKVADRERQHMLMVFRLLMIRYLLMLSLG